MILTLMLITIFALIGSLIWAVEKCNSFLALFLYLTYIILALKISFMICWIQNKKGGDLLTKGLFICVIGYKGVL